MPEYIEEAVIKLIENEQYRRNLGKKAQKYVKCYCSPKKVAERYVKIISNDIPEEWWFDPEDIEYFLGYGYSRTDVKKRVNDIVNEYGKIEDLCLSNNLQKKISKVFTHPIRTYE